MNLALFTELEKVDGQGRYALMLARWFSRRGHHVVVFSPIGPLLEEIAGTPVVHVPIGSVRQVAPLQYEELVGDVARLVDACREHAIEAMIATAKFPYMMARAALGERMHVVLPILSETYFLPQSPYYATEMQRAAREGRILAYAYKTADVHAKNYGFDPSDVRYGTFPIDARTEHPNRARAAVRAELGFEDDELLVLSICRLDVDKAPGIPPLSRAVDRVRERTGKRIRLVHVGDGTLAAQTRAQASPTTVFLGTRHDLADLYHACDIYVGEGTTITEAAMARRPVVIAWTSLYPQQAEMAFGLYGLHVVDFGFVEWSNHAPPTPFEEALFYLAQDAELRRRLGAAAHATVLERNGVDRVLPWLEALLQGEPRGNQLFHERAAAIVTVRGGLDDGIDAVAELCYERGAELQLGVEVATPLPWGRALAMPLEHVQALSVAVRRLRDAATPRAFYDGRRLVAAEAIPAEIRLAFAQREGRLPPTSFTPPFALDPPRSPMHAIFASDEAGAVRLLQALQPGPEAAVVIWIPRNDLDARAVMRQLEAVCTTGIVLICEPLAWTVIGRVLSDVATYCDDGSERFADHRRLVRDRGRTTLLSSV